MAENADIPEDQWIRHRIWRLRALRRLVTDDRAIRAINDLIAEAEERLEAIEARAST